MTCISYCEKIEEIFDAMIRLADEVLPENRKEVNEYIYHVWKRVTVFVRSIKREKERDAEELMAKFESYVIAEEARLHRNLEDIRYDIDSFDTVRLIAGNGRPETVISQIPFLCFDALMFKQFLFPMLYLALKRDLERISLARKYALSQFELWDAVETIIFIKDAAEYRSADLKGEIAMHPHHRFLTRKFHSHLRTTESRCQGAVQSLREGPGMCPRFPIII